MAGEHNERRHALSARTPRAAWSIRGPAAADRMTPATLRDVDRRCGSAGSSVQLLFGQGSSEGELCLPLTPHQRSEPKTDELNRADRLMSHALHPACLLHV